MSEQIRKFKVTKGYGKVKTGLDFSVNDKNSRYIDASIEEGIAEVANISMNEAKTARCNIEYEEI
jgi:hypothetical protein